MNGHILHSCFEAIRRDLTIYTLQTKT